MHKQGEEVHVTDTEASGGSKEGVVRWVLAGGLLLAILLLSVTWIVPALSTGDVEEEGLSEIEGIIIGRTNMPVVNEGDALFHIALTPSEKVAEAVVGEMSAQREAAPLFDEDEII